MSKALAMMLAALIMLLPGCGMLTEQTVLTMTEKMELGVATFTAGEYEAEGTIKKDGKMLGRFYGKMECTKGQDGKLAGCHQRLMTFTPGGGQ